MKTFKNFVLDEANILVLAGSIADTYGRTSAWYWTGSKIVFFDKAGR